MVEEKYPEPLEKKSVRREVESKLNLGEGKIEQYLDSGAVKFMEDYPSYIRFRRHVGGVQKGTNVFFMENDENEFEVDIVRGFPKIERILMIERGMKKNFDSPIHVEEKLNGYNVRLAKVFDDVKALTRGGLNCPYTNYSLKSEKESSFFKENPDLMLCGEVIGQNNPYVEKEYPEEDEFGFYVFDIRNKYTGKAEKIDEKHRLLEKHGIKKTNSLGVFDPSDGCRLLQLVRDMGKEGREGVVLKSKDMEKQFKYTSNDSSNSELNYAFTFWGDYGRDFILRRIVREAFQAHEKGLSGDELKEEAHKLGENILLPFVDTLKKLDAGERVTEEFKLNVPTKEFGKAYVRYLRHIGIDAEIKEVREKKGEIEVVVLRRYPSTNDKTKHYLKGNVAKD